METTANGTVHPHLDWHPRGEIVLGIWAHPDDETYLAAGLTDRAVRAGGRVVVRHATRGERGTPDPDTWPPDRLAAVREREAAASLAVLGITDHGFLGHADGGCAQVAPGAVVGGLVELIRTVRPDVLVTFGPDGITGHPDHVTVSRWVTTAWCAAGYGRLLYAVSTRSFARRFAGTHRRLGLTSSVTPAMPDDVVALAVRLTEAELDRKRAALAAHASQTDGLAAVMGERTYRRWYDVETFRAPTAAELDAAGERTGVTT
jgi:LmbE family N-acetylglucosaminyl deacetylase